MDNNDDFLDWLEEIKFLLPPHMSVHEARILFNQKVKEERELRDEDTL